MRLSSVTGPIRISQYAHAVVLEENMVQLWIGYCGIWFHLASLLRFARKKVRFRSSGRCGRFDGLQTLSPTPHGTQPGPRHVRADAAHGTQPNALAADV